jgi:hypothetical protein
MLSLSTCREVLVELKMCPLFEPEIPPLDCATCPSIIVSYLFEKWGKLLVQLSACQNCVGNAFYELNIDNLPFAPLVLQMVPFAVQVAHADVLHEMSAATDDEQTASPSTGMKSPAFVLFTRAMERIQASPPRFLARRVRHRQSPPRVSFSSSRRCSSCSPMFFSSKSVHNVVLHFAVS